MGKKEKVLDMLAYTRQEEQAFIDVLTEEERTFAGTLEHWSAKDLLAHLYAWKADYVRRLELVVQGKTPEPVGDIDEANAAIYNAHCDKTWDEARREWEQANADLVARAETFTEEELIDPQRFPGTNGQPLWRGFAGTGLVHTSLHFGEFYANRGDVERANTFQLTAVDLLLGLDDSENWRSVVLYNLACHYAITQQPDTAIPKLREAFALNAGLADYSKQDTDLKSLWELADYRTLVEV